MGQKQEAFNRALDRAVPGAVAALDAAKLNGEIARLKADLAEAVAALNGMWDAPVSGDSLTRAERDRARARAWAVIEKHR